MSSWICSTCGIKKDDSKGKFFKRTTQKKPKHFIQVYICSECISMIKAPRKIKRRK